MKSNDAKTTTVMVLILVLLIPIVYSVGAFVFGQATPGDELFLERPDEKYETCIRDAEYMRFHHMAFLDEMRIKVVRGGDRESLVFDKCRECHPNRKQFCNRCHDAVSLKPDCWGCHYYPETPEDVEEGTHGEETI